MLNVEKIVKHRNLKKGSNFMVRKLKITYFFKQYNENTTKKPKL